MSNESQVAADREAIVEAKGKGRLATMLTYSRLSGPGWLQSAITLGGGSLGSSLYLGVLAGYSFLWLQPLAMILGIVMLSAIGYVTLSTGERPFGAINRFNPVLGWGWALAALAANVIWVMPQYALAFGALEQNLLPESVTGSAYFKVVISILILLFSIAVTWSYDSGTWGVKLYEIVLKILVALIVLSFFGVVVTLARNDPSFDLGAILGGFVPDFGAVFRPADTYANLLGDVVADYRGYWSDLIVDKQRDVMISAAATAVGINMTFLFPYTLLKRGWGKEFRGLAVFDLSTGMLIPFLLATSCVVVASASQFHAKAPEGLVEGTLTSGKQFGEYQGLLTNRIKLELGEAEFEAIPAAAVATRLRELPEADRRLAATMVTRDALDLAQALKPLTGEPIANLVFGFGVLAMALSTITLLMLISGFVVCEMLNLPSSGWPHRLGTLAAATGVFWPLIWGDDDARFWLAISASVLGFTLLPIAYLAFFFLMNQKKLLGESMPTGGKRLLWNILMGIAAAVATVGSVYMLWKKAGVWGLVIAAAFGILVLLGFLIPLVMGSTSSKPSDR